MVSEKTKQKMRNKRKKKINWTSEKLKTLPSKDIVKEMKRQIHRPGGNICKSYLWYGLVSKICKEFLELNDKKTNNPTLKVGEWS